jgi:hypothetical protein
MGFVNFIGDNSISINAVEYETKLRSDDPQLLLPTENVIYAFHGRGGEGRDYFALTSHRVLVRDKKGMTGKRIRYISVPYSAVIAFSIETAGGIVDSDQELILHCRGIGKVSIDFDCNVNSLFMYRFLSTVIFNTKGATGFDAKAFAIDATITTSGGGGGAVGSILNVLGSDYSQMNPSALLAWRENTNFIASHCHTGVGFVVVATEGGECSCNNNDDEEDTTCCRRRR